MRKPLPTRRQQVRNASTYLLHRWHCSFDRDLDAGTAAAETGYDGWLRYAPLDDAIAKQYEPLPAAIVALGDSAVVESASEELVRGVRGMLKRDLRIAEAPLAEDAIVLGTVAEIRKALPSLAELPSSLTTVSCSRWCRRRAQLLVCREFERSRRVVWHVCAAAQDRAERADR